jgi:hypothetical protein
MRLVAKTAPMRQLEVARELRARVKATLDAAGVQPAGPDTIVISAPPALAAPAPAADGLAETEAGEPPVAEDVLVAAEEAKTPSIRGFLTPDHGRRDNCGT